MAVTIKQLADGQLPDSIGDLYTVPANTSTIVNSIRCVNTHTAAVTMNIYLLPSGGTAKRIIPKDMSFGVQYLLVIDDEISLETGDKLQGDATTAAKVDYTIGGIEHA